jgi:sugar/nucleoside kinase (ribokinase family)
MPKKALVYGSIVYDEIFSIKGDIKNEIPLKNGKINNINLFFTANTKKRYFGGTAGNIAYGLCLLKEKPLVFSCVGKDFDLDYKDHLKKLGCHLRVFKSPKDIFCATFYSISDNKYQQIGIFQPNSYGNSIGKTLISKTLKPNDFSKIKVAIFSPGTGISIYKNILELKEKTKQQITKIFDPGQELSMSLNNNLLDKILPLSNIVIVNEVELMQFKQLYNLGIKEILKKGPKYLIETQGEKGSLIYFLEEDRLKKIKIPPNKVTQVKEATGAGDAFRAGLIKGLLNDWPIEKAARLGSKMGALNVETFGGQGYRV